MMLIMKHLKNLQRIYCEKYLTSARIRIFLPIWNERLPNSITSDNIYRNRNGIFQGDVCIQ